MFAGPPGAGKSTLRQSFDKRMVAEKDGQQTEAFQNKQLEETYQKYKEVKQINPSISIDFNLFKERLPEYNQENNRSKEKFGDMYGVIRSESAGLNEAIIQLAKEYGAINVREQLMDVDLTKPENKNDFGRLIFVGITTDADTVNKRVKLGKEKFRCSPMKSLVPFM